MSISITVDISNIVDGQNIDAADVTLPFNQIKTVIENMLNGVQSFDKLLFSAAETNVINAGVITPSKSYVDVDTQGAASTDDLDTINGGSEGRILLLRNSSGRTVVVKHNTGNIYTADAADYSLDNVRKWALLLYSGSNSRWLVLSGGGAAASGLSYSDILKVQVFS